MMAVFWEDAIDSATQALEKYNIESLEQTCEWPL